MPNETVIIGLRTYVRTLCVSMIAEISDLGGNLITNNKEAGRMTTYPLPTDNDLSRLASSKFFITKTILPTSASDEELCGTEKQLGTEQPKKATQLRLCQQKRSQSQSQQQQGVPGFPDFPSFWAGEEGWVFWKRTGIASKQSAKLARVASRHTNPLRREAANKAGIKSKQKVCRNTAVTKEVKVRKKSQDKKKRILKIRDKRQMVALRRSLSSLSCK